MKKFKVYQPRFKKPTVQEALAWTNELITEVHEMCLRVPTIRADDFDRLVDSIKEHGLLTPLMIDSDGVLVDGRCRLQACMAAGLRVEDLTFDYSEVAPEIIAQANIARRHLTSDQMAVLSLNSLKVERAAATERKMLGKNQFHVESEELAAKPVASSDKPSRRASALDTVASQSAVSRRKLALAEKIESKSKKIAKQVESGHLTLDQARRELKIAPPKRSANAGSKKQKHVLPVGKTTWLSPNVAATLDTDGLLVIETSELILYDHDDLEATVSASLQSGSWLLAGVDTNNTQAVFTQADAKLALRAAVLEKIESQGWGFA